MYPHTTALYCATVVDNTTYCREQDDIIVVEFDGDEDDKGSTPQRHIPARFVTLIPREFPASQSNKKRKKSGTLAPVGPMSPERYAERQGLISNATSSAPLPAFVSHNTKIAKANPSAPRPDASEAKTSDPTKKMRKGMGLDYKQHPKMEDPHGIGDPEIKQTKRRKRGADLRIGNRQKRMLGN